MVSENAIKFAELPLNHWAQDSGIPAAQTIVKTPVA